MTRFGHARSLAIAALLVGCSSTSLTTANDVDAGGPAAEGGQACNAQTQAGIRVVGDAVTAASSDLSCTTDDDCTLAPNATVCTTGCGVLLNRAGAARVKAAVDSVNTTTCGSFEANGCFNADPPCLPPVGGAACVASKCAAFPPAAWGSFSVQQAPAGTVRSTWPSCPPATSCTSWELTPDGAIVVTSPTGIGAKVLAAGDFATVDGILKSLTFRQSEISGFDCATNANATAVVWFNVGRAIGTTGHDVTGCVLASARGATTSDARRVYDVISAY